MLSPDGGVFVFTGKNTDFSEFDENVNYQAIINFRDCICHQDVAHYKAGIDALLNNPERLKQIMENDLPKLLEKITFLTTFTTLTY